MKIIQHRVNTAAQLSEVPEVFGVEIDIRSDMQGLYLSHDPFQRGERLHDYLMGYNHSLLILNLKEDGLEQECEKLLRGCSIKDFLFLDQALPSLVKRGKDGHRNGFCRLSEFETIESVIAISKFCDWVWLDNFTGNKFQQSDIRKIKDIGMKVCLVSPELHTLNRYEEAVNLGKRILSGIDLPDAVCTKYPSIWDVGADSV